MYEQVKEKIVRRYKREFNKFKARFFCTYSKKVVKVINYPFIEVGTIRVIHFDIFGVKFLSTKNKEGICIDEKFLRDDNQINVNHRNKSLSATIASRIELIDPMYKLINWERDFLSGYSWDTSIFHTDIDHIGNGKGIDIKSAWELARFQHVTFMLGHQLHRELVCQLLDFISSHPPGFGPNWKCSMEVGIRAMNILLAYGTIKETSDIPSQLRNEILEIISCSLYDHIDYVSKNLEVYNGQGNNHYLSNLSTLVILTNALNLKGKYCKYLSLFKTEVTKQFHKEGTNFEGSTNYHRLSTELFFYTIYFTTTSDNRFDGQNHLEVAIRIWGEDVIDLLYNVFDSFLYILKPNGEIPNIGDNDSGRFLILNHDRTISDGRYLLAIGAPFFKEIRWKIKEFIGNDNYKEVFTLYGGRLYKWFQDTQSANSLKDISSKVFYDAGWAIMRDDSNYCIISFGKLGTNGTGGHDHDDKLSYELVIGGNNSVMDRGTCCYTPFPDIREEFCSIESHNLPYFEGACQNEYLGLFRRREKAYPELLRFNDDSDFIYFKGHQYGFGGKHIREITWDKKQKRLSVSDRFDGRLDDIFAYNQVYSPNAELRVETSGKVAKYDAEISPEYRVVENAVKYKIHSKNYSIS